MFLIYVLRSNHFHTVADTFFNMQFDYQINVQMTKLALAVTLISANFDL